MPFFFSLKENNNSGYILTVVNTWGTKKCKVYFFGSDEKKEEIQFMEDSIILSLLK